jgi:uncharacterized protein YuzE
MQINYDLDANAIYIHFREGDIEETREVSKNIYVDVDKDGSPLGLEILYAKHTLAVEDVTSVTVNIARPPQPALPG